MVTIGYTILSYNVGRQINADTSNERRGVFIQIVLPGPFLNPAVIRGQA